MDLGWFYNLGNVLEPFQYDSPQSGDELKKKSHRKISFFSCRKCILKKYFFLIFWGSKKVKNFENPLRIFKKVDLFRKKSNNYSAYINIGGGAASMGRGIFKDTVKVGLITPLDIEYMELDAFEKSVAYHFIKTDEDYDQIPIINITKIWGFCCVVRHQELMNLSIFIRYSIRGLKMLN